MKKGSLLSIVLASILPSIAFAQGTIRDFRSLVSFIISTINLLNTVIVALALLYFMWGLFKYIRAGGNEKELSNAKNFIIFGLIGMAVMFSVWALVLTVTNTFFPTSALTTPQLR